MSEERKLEGVPVEDMDQISMDMLHYIRPAFSGDGEHVGSEHSLNPEGPFIPCDDQKHQMFRTPAVKWIQMSPGQPDE